MLAYFSNTAENSRRMLFFWTSPECLPPVSCLSFVSSTEIKIATGGPSVLSEIVGVCRARQWLTAISWHRKRAVLGAYLKHTRAVWQLRSMGTQAPAMVTQPPAQGDYGGDLVPWRAPMRRLERI